MKFNDKIVISVYSGKANKCCCGCSGKHYYAPGMGEEDYQVENAAQVTRVINKIQKAHDQGRFIDDDDPCITCLEENGRWYIVYTA